MKFIKNLLKNMSCSKRAFPYIIILKDQNVSIWALGTLAGKGISSLMRCSYFPLTKNLLLCKLTCKVIGHKRLYRFINSIIIILVFWLVHRNGFENYLMNIMNLFVNSIILWLQCLLLNDEMVNLSIIYLLVRFSNQDMPLFSNVRHVHMFNSNWSFQQSEWIRRQEWIFACWRMNCLLIFFLLQDIAGFYPLFIRSTLH